MKAKTDLEYLRLNWFQKAIYNIGRFFVSIPGALWNFIKNIGLTIWKGILKVKDEFVEIYTTFVNGDWKTKTSYLVMGFGNIARGQILRGLLFLLFEAVFIFYMITTGFHWLDKFRTLGTVEQERYIDPVWDVEVIKEGDDSFKILLYGLLTIIFIIAFIVTWRINVKQNKIAEDILRTGKPLKSGKQDLQSLLDDQFHKTLLALPVLGIFLFTVVPIIFMILVAFTNYDGINNGYSKLFTWVGWENFNYVLNFKAATGNITATFGEILTWTLIWAFFATFTNYFLGMFVAMMINRKGIKFKKLWRGILVLTIAVPQFVSLTYIRHMFDKTSIINTFLVKIGVLAQNFDFWGNATAARILVILINIWIGIPYLMLIISGVLMNIPQDLYESSKIDGANAFQQYTRITLPYVLFVTGPYLLTSFIANINNFNVIYLLSEGNPLNPAMTVNGVAAGDTDLLITWMFKITTGPNSSYHLASVIGIIIFAVVAILSLIVYNVIPSTKNEEDYQ